MMMKNYDELGEIICNPNWPYISNAPYRILIYGGSGSGGTNVLLNLLNLIKHQRPDLVKFIYMSKVHSNQIKVSIAYHMKRKRRD